MSSTILFKKFGIQKRWVNWQYKKVNGKLTKVPYGVDQSPARSNDDSTWMTYERAAKISENIGIMAMPDKKTLLVDFDNCLMEDWGISGVMEKEITEFVKQANTYTEVSPSKNGLHLFLELSEPFDPVVKKHVINDKEKIECYTHGRYFTVTNNSFGKEKKVRTISKEEAIALLAIVGYPWNHTATPPLSSPKQASLPTSQSIGISDGDLLQKMFSSPKNGSKIQELYQGDISAYNNDDSAADMALMNHFAFWTAKNPELMEAMWLASPLGQRKKTQTRKAYRDATIMAAIKNCKDIYEPTPTSYSDEAFPISEKIELLTQLRGKNEVIVVNTENIIRILRSHRDFKKTIRLEVFENRIEVFNQGVWGPMQDSDIVRIQCQIATLFPPFRMVNSKMVWDAIIFMAAENTYDSATHFLQSLVWDKVPRLDTWLVRTYGVPDDGYHKAVGSNWVKGLVSRIVYPGCKFDHVLVLEGPQGTKKSTSLFTLGENWHLETTMATDNKDFFMQFAGKAIIEFSEGETLSRTEVKRLKAIITMQRDKFRPPWGRTSQEFPRRCVFAMTTNETEYLKDDTGNRRWLPVTLVKEEADIDWLKVNRNQLLAEAYYRVSVLKESIHEFPKAEMLAEQQKRKVQDPNSDVVVDWYWTELSVGDRVNGITVSQAYKVISGGYIHKAMTKMDEMNLAAILRDAIGLEKRRVMIGGSRAWRWYRKEGEPDPMEGKEISVLEKLRRHY